MLKWRDVWGNFGGGLLVSRHRCTRRKQNGRLIRRPFFGYSVMHSMLQCRQYMVRIVMYRP
jgi:hypothetical protein